MGFLLKLQTLDEETTTRQHVASISTFSLTLCLSTTSQIGC